MDITCANICASITKLVCIFKGDELPRFYKQTHFQGVRVDFTKFTDKEDLLTVDSPIFMKDEKKRKPQTAPEIGEHTRQILEELNYDKKEIDKLENKKIIRT